jgi:ornithine cyclodeaminase
VCTVRRITKIWVYDVEPEKSFQFIAEMKQRPELARIDFRASDSPAEAVSDADIICTATTSSLPVFDDRDLKTGVHINGVGSYTPKMQEIPSQTVQRAKVIVDSRQAALAEAGDIIIPLEEGQISESHIVGEIGEVASGRIPGRTSKEELTFFKSVGVAVQDAAVASEIFGRCQELGLGAEVDI